MNKFLDAAYSQQNDKVENSETAQNNSYYYVYPSLKGI